MAGGSKAWVWVVVAAAAGCVVCSAGGALLFGVAAFTDADAPGAQGPEAPEGQPGEAGGFSFTPPQGWTSPGAGRVAWTGKDRDAVLGVEVIRLPAISGREDGEAKVARLWSERIGADWDGVKAAPMVLRRFVANGARAYFTSGVVKPKGGGIDTRVSVYLVEAGDRLEPLVVLQTYREDTTFGETTVNHMAQYSWDTTHEQVEQALAGVRGSPVGLALVSDDEVVGTWNYGSSTAAQWVNTLTGSTSMTAVAYSVDYVFGDDHRFTYKYGGASGQVGAMQFGTDSDEGEWRVEHDQLVVSGKSQRKYLIAGAARTPQGKRSLFLLPHPRWSLAPGGLAQNGELFVEK